MSLQRLPWPSRSVPRPSWPVVALLVVALVSTTGWAVSTFRRPAAAPAAAAPGAVPGGVAPHQHGGTANKTPPVTPVNGVVELAGPELPQNAVNFIWKPEHVVVTPGQQVTFKVANSDYMQHNFTFKPAKVAKNLPVGATTTIRFTAPQKPGAYWFYCKYHLQMMEGAVTVR
jgi:plastocyanin